MNKKQVSMPFVYRLEEKMNSLLDINLKKIQYFVQIVEKGSMSAASKSLYVTQPLLSKNIKSLEDFLGFDLFIREKRSLQLTKAGKYLYEQWSNLVQQIEFQTETARRLHQSDQQYIHFGCEDMLSLGANDLFMNDIVRYQQANELININMNSYPMKVINAQFLSGKLDIITCLSVDVKGFETDYHVADFGKLQHCLYGRKGHPILSSKDELTWRDLREYPFYTISPEIALWPEHLLLSYTHEAGFHPKIAGYTTSQMEQVLKIKMSDAIMFSVDLNALSEDNLLSRKKLNSFSSLSLVWKKEQPILDTFADYLLSKKALD